MGRMWNGSGLPRAVAMVMAVLLTVGVVPSGGDAGDGSVLASTSDAPNVVVIMTDDQTMEQLGVMPTTESLIGAAGVSFTNFVVTESLCCPSRATYQTGQYAFHHGVLSNGGAFGGYQAFDASTALPVWLQGAGYRTIHLGKYLNGYGQEDPTEVPPGWDDWQGLVDPSYYDYRLNDNGTVVTYGNAPEDYSTDVLGSRAIEAINESAPGGPFYLNLALFAPHVEESDALSTAIPAPRHVGAFASEPLPRPPSFNEADVSDKPAHIRALSSLNRSTIDNITTRWRDRQEAMLAVDEMVGQVVAALDATGELDNTVVMFTSDNGFEEGQHRIETGKAQPYEESIHMPLLVRGPGFPAGTAFDGLAANIDLAPTIAGIAGAAPLIPVDGIDLDRLMTDPGAYADRAIGLELYEEHCYTGLRTASEVYVRYYTGEEELYDLASDPYELTSLHADPAHEARRLEMASSLAALIPNPPLCGPFANVNIGDVTVSEPRSGRAVSISVPVTMSDRTRETMTVPYRIEAGTADGNDAILGTGSLLIGRDAPSTTISVSIKSDKIPESTESLTVTLDPPASLPTGVTFGRTTAVVTILDRPSSSPNTVAVGDVRIWEGSQQYGYLPVTLAAAAAVDTTISYTVLSGTANSTDYSMRSGSVVIKAGKNSALLKFQTLGDYLREPDETFTVTLIAPGLTVERTTGTITILNDDVEA